MSAGGSAFTALVLAASRGAEDPVARAEGKSHKCLAEIAGRPMIEHVLATLAASPAVGRIAISIESEGVLDGLPEAGRLRDQDRLAVLASAESASASILEAAERLGGPWPLLVTTGDNPLLTGAMIDHFRREALAAGADFAAALAPEAEVRKAQPDARRTYLAFRDARYSGCNLFAVLTPAGLEAIRFWRRAEQHRKRPWRLVSFFGLGSLLLFLLRRLTLDQAFARASARLGIRAKAVAMPFPTAAIDVDKPSDLALARKLVVEASEARPQST